MSHDLEINRDGSARFAYANHQAPWHHLGVPMNGLQTLDAMLAAAQADFDVVLTRVAAVDEHGNVLFNPARDEAGQPIVDDHGQPVMVPVIIEDSRATVRVNRDGTFDDLATVGTRYTVRQNRETIERALAVVGASTGDAVIDTLGVLDGGRRFFTTIDLGPLVIDPRGAADRITRYMVVSSGHDGVWPIKYSLTEIRAVCKNTVILGQKQAQRTFTARHTRNVDTALDDAQTVLGISVEWAKSFKAMAEQMLAIPVTANSGRLDRVIDSVFPAAAADTDRKRANRDEIVGLIHGLYANDRNAGSVGTNGWAAWNSVVEYLDHYRDATPYERALTSMDDNSWVTRAKLTAQQAVLALA